MLNDILQTFIVPELIVVRPDPEEFLTIFGQDDHSSGPIEMAVLCAFERGEYYNPIRFSWRREPYGLSVHSPVIHVCYVLRGGEEIAKDVKGMIFFGPNCPFGGSKDGPLLL